MEIDVYWEGIEEAMESLSRAVEATDKALQDAFEWILREMVNYVKDNGPWEDQSSALRNSISVNIEAMKLTPQGQDPGPDATHRKPVIQVEGDDYIGVLSAGMEYAIWVELADGYWVLTGAIDKFEPLMTKYFQGFLSVEKLDLEHAARIQQARYERRAG